MKTLKRGNEEIEMCRSNDPEMMLMSAVLLKKRLWHRCFPVNFAKFLRTLFCAKYLCATAFKGGVKKTFVKHSSCVDAKKNIISLT